jgi:acetyl esterase
LTLRVALLRLVLRLTGADEAPARAAALRPLVPGGVRAHLDLRYNPGEPDALLDVFHPAGARSPLPTVIWVHGGSWIGGSKRDMREYLQILAGHGYTTVGVEYTRAPRRHHPAQARQVGAAVAYLRDSGPALPVDPARFVLAGDSAGAQIAAQLACVITDPGYAAAVGISPPIDPAALRAALLICGAYDLAPPPRPRRQRWVVDTILRAYSGVADYRNDPLFRYALVARWLTPAFPPAFITAGNGDPLLPQSRRLAAALAGLGTPAEPFFFDDTPDDLAPHEYHLDLHTQAARIALDRMLAHLARHTGLPGV